MKGVRKILFAFMEIVALGSLYAQDNEDYYEQLLNREVEVNPVYMPVIGVGIGYLNYYGDVEDAFRSYTAGKTGTRVNVSVFLGKKHHFKGNLFFLTGSLTGTQRSVFDSTRNLNFSSNIYNFGANIQYSFQPLLKGKYFEPFVSVGIETLQFDSKADYLDRNGLSYHYWSDGTIRTISEKAGDPGNMYITQRDYVYETDLRKTNRSGLGNYGQMSLAIPVEAGFDFRISNRVTLRAATSLHYTFTDLADDMTSQSNAPNYRGKSGNDMYAFTYVSLHLDLFSSPKTKIVEDVYASLDDFDLSMYDDGDNDGVFDGFDDCPGTPEGIPVDSVGCPFDTDSDGIPDYLDREASASGAIVDEYGVEIRDGNVASFLEIQAINRSDVEAYLAMYRGQNEARRTGPVVIPDKFKRIDTDRDGYISFDELLKEVDNYFDGTSNYTPDEIKELNNFFFDQ